MAVMPDTGQRSMGTLVFSVYVPCISFRGAVAGGTCSCIALLCALCRPLADYCIQQWILVFPTAVVRLRLCSIIKLEFH